MESVAQIVLEHPVCRVTLRRLSGRGDQSVGEVVLEAPSGERRTNCGTVAPNGFLRDSARLISDYLDGGFQDLSGIPVDLDDHTTFQRAVLETARLVRRGETVSYTELATRAGYPRAVRAVASVMRHNRFPLLIPCHRVIRSDGSHGGFMGVQTGDEIALKLRLLALEGVKTSR